MSAKDPQNWLNAGIFLFEKTNVETKGVYHFEISNQLFEIANWSAKYELWYLVNKAVKAALKISPGSVPSGSTIFQLVFKIFPFFAFYMRKKILSKIKPEFYE